MLPCDIDVSFLLAWVNVVPCIWDISVSCLGSRGAVVRKVRAPPDPAVPENDALDHPSAGSAKSALNGTAIAIRSAVSGVGPLRANVNWMPAVGW